MMNVGGLFSMSLAMILVGLCFPAVSVSADEGVILGTVTYEGRVPRMRAIQVDGDPLCAAIHAGKEPPKADWLLLSEDRGLANVIVQVVKGVPKKEYPVPAEPLELTQAGCMYEPHVFVVRAGQAIRVLNPDETLHNIHFLPKVNSEYNRSMPKTRKEITHVLRKAEPVFTIKCDVHKWMKAHCAVLDHPFYGVTGMDGAYSIPDLPAGDYTLEFWHEKLGTIRREVSVLASGGVTEDVVYTMENGKK